MKEISNLAAVICYKYTEELLEQMNQIFFDLAQVGSNVVHGKETVHAFTNR